MGIRDSITGWLKKRASVRFIILFEGRTGSTWLCDMLDKHPGIRCYHEILIKAGRNGGQEGVHRCFENAMSVGPGSPKVVGLKAKLRQVFDLDAFRDLLVRNRTRVIHMSRRNVIKQTISEYRGLELNKRTGKFILFRDEDRVEASEIDTERFEKMFKLRLKRDQILENFIAGLKLPVTSVHYENLYTDTNAALQKVFSFLSVPAHPVESTLLKHTSDNLRDAVTNLDQLRMIYKGTVYEPMFDEVLNPAAAAQKRAVA